MRIIDRIAKFYYTPFYVVRPIAIGICIYLLYSSILEKEENVFTVLYKKVVYVNSLFGLGLTVYIISQMIRLS